MRRDPRAQRQDAHLRPPSALADLDPFLPRSPLARINDALDYAAPIIFGLKLWTMPLRRLIQPDRPHREADPIG